METVTMRIDGMSCGHCVKAVRDALADVPGVEVERVEVGSATIRVDPAVAGRERVADAVRDAGYEPAEA